MSGEERQSKWRRAKSPDPLELQPRDHEIVAAVHEFGFLARDQIQQLFGFNCTTRANIRLRKLFDHGYLVRRFLPTALGSSKAVYFLGPQGIRLISEKRGIDPPVIKKRQKSCLGKKELFLDHDLMVNEVRISFRRAFDNQQDLRMDRWIDPIGCLQKYTVFNPKLNRECKVIFRPDGYLRYFHNGKLFGCFLEVDRSTMSNARFQAKVKVYLDYAQSGLYQQRYGLKFFRVLVVTKTNERLINLKSATEKLTDKIFWFTTADKLTANGVFDEIWEKPAKPGTFSLLRQ